MTTKENRPAGYRAARTSSISTDKFTTSSSQVNWWTVHRFVTAVLEQVDDWPTAGTSAWCSLSHDDPRKWAALLDAAQHHALRVETAQQAECEASSEISAAEDWGAVARARQRHANAVASGAYIPRRAAS